MTRSTRLTSFEAHPRSRGENGRTCWRRSDLRGSSPLTRGKPHQRRCPCQRARLIPAHAGKTGYLTRWTRQFAAHPRSRGENSDPDGRLSINTGSSPLTRGKLSQVRGRQAHQRLIPAHAGKTRRRWRRTRAAPAHPRSRGENPSNAAPGDLICGSSPLTRGKPRATRQCHCLVGLIPAHAGKTRRSGCVLPGSKAHPRSRGENACMTSGLASSSGSSPLTRGKLFPLSSTLTAGGLIPLTRGKHRKDIMDPVAIRLIPAHAGKTARAPVISSAQAAHPRSRGENRVLLVNAKFENGSSPLTRGKPRRFDDRDTERRLIPAHAGKTWSDTTQTVSMAAHPRSRGENTTKKRSAPIKTGSSPLTRGKQAHRLDRVPSSRLIPAHAGKTSRRRSPCASAAAHPRSRGENGLVLSGQARRAGSSPLTRGKLLDLGFPCGVKRLIPAHAGKTPHPPPGRAFPPAHPRSRGENALDFNPNHTLGGSSPLTRGKHTIEERQDVRGRLIPAHAGKTGQAGDSPHCQTAHPRSRGENHSGLTTFSQRVGSSPLTRGKQTGWVVEINALRLIPAHAGKTPRPKRLCARTPAHPRSRGENLAGPLLGRYGYGSSPLTRGKRNDRCCR